jgi:uncharacterized protein with HEPN domain
MQDEDRDLAYLWDMREEARNIVSFVKDISYNHFAQNTLVRYAVERSLMIIGEAANHISENYKEEHSEIAWRQIIGQRNVLAHEYGDINFEVSGIQPL